jgi:hypothetical protein
MKADNQGKVAPKIWPQVMLVRALTFFLEQGLAFQVKGAVKMQRRVSFRINNFRQVRLEAKKVKESHLKPIIL